MQVPIEVVARLDPEQAALAAGVGRLEHGREADLRQRSVGFVQPADRREPRLRHACLGQRAAHRDLVRHPVRRVHADPGQAQPVGHRCDDGHGAVGGDRQHPVHLVCAAQCGNVVERREVDPFADVRDREPGRVLLRVDRDDAQAAGARLLDRTALMDAGADEEDGLHAARILAG